jgi:PTH1 family peptidyl-tRNA hydrolase
MIRSFFKNRFSKIYDSENPIHMKKFLVVGLGNIGLEYRHSRHNIGFTILDFFAERENLTFTTQKLGDIAVHKINGAEWTFLKPSTYMNNSGKAVLYWLNKEKIPIEQLLIVTDDINIPFGSMRIRQKGSHGGHNGLRDVEFQLGTQEYNRLRVGIGSDFPPGKQVEYVLGKWTSEELNTIPDVVVRGYRIIKTIGLEGFAQAMNKYNAGDE